MTGTEKALTATAIAAGVVWALSRSKGGQAVTVDAVAEVIRAGGAVVDALRPRGIRNNNPGNIDWIKDPAKRWRGMVALEPPGSVYGKGYAARFGVFDTPANGVRAIGKELLLDATRGVRTVRALINNWAPPGENDTSSYVLRVAEYVDVGPDENIDIARNLVSLVAAIIKHEQGEQPYSSGELELWARAA